MITDFHQELKSYFGEHTEGVCALIEDYWRANEHKWQVLWAAREQKIDALIEAADKILDPDWGATKGTLRALREARDALRGRP